MGVAFYPVFEDGTGGWSEDINGKCLAHAANCLAAAAKKAGVPSLYDFYSMTRRQAICELLMGDPDDPSTFDETKVPQESWYDSLEGAYTVRTLLEFVKSDCGGIDDIDCVLEDLEAIERRLVSAGKRGIRWHLVIDA